MQKAYFCRLMTHTYICLAITRLVLKIRINFYFLILFKQNYNWLINKLYTIIIQKIIRKNLSAYLQTKSAHLYSRPLWYMREWENKICFVPDTWKKSGISYVATASSKNSIFMAKHIFCMQTCATSAPFTYKNNTQTAHWKGSEFF